MKLATTTLVFCVAALLSLGMVMLYSSSMVQSGTHFLVNQLVWGCLGIAVCVGMACLDYQWLKKYSWVLLAFSVFLLLLVFVPHVGIGAKGARRWIGYGGARFQPSELAKLSLVIFLAWYGERNQRHMGSFKRGLLIPGAIVAVVLGLIFIEPDRGTTILLALVSGMLLVIAGVRWRFVAPIVVLLLGGLAYSLSHDSMRMGRIYSWTHLEETKLGKGMQAYQAMLAFGSGGWTGLGLGNGRQKLGFVPEHHTDFIFSIVGEELGLVATMGILVGFLLLLVCGIFIASRARDTFGMLLASGMTFLIGLQALINIGVVTGALPNKGMPLPFISYGGSNLLVMLLAVGILLSVARQGLAVAAPVRNANPFAGPVPQPT